MNLLLYKFILYGRLYGRTVFLIVPLAFVKCGRAVFFGYVHISMNFRFLNKTKQMPNRSLFFALQPSCGPKQAENKSVFYNEVNGVCVTMRQKGNQSGIHKCLCLTWEQDRNRKIPQIFHEQWLNSRRRNSKKKYEEKKRAKKRTQTTIKFKRFIWIIELSIYAFYLFTVCQQQMTSNQCQFRWNWFGRDQCEWEDYNVFKVSTGGMCLEFITMVNWQTKCMLWAMINFWCIEGYNEKEEEMRKGGRCKNSIELCVEI